MAAVTLLPAPAAGLALDQLQADEQRIVAELATTAPEAACPLCGRAATRAQSHYWRHLADLPWQGVPVVVRLRARRFWCDNPDCARVIFTERVPALAAPYARRTARLAAVLTQIGFALGGEGGARLLAALGMAASPDTLLGLVRQAPLAAPPTPRVLGIDDFALRRGRTYGTLLIDLERHAAVDLLPDRDAESVARWLAAHPGVEVISRDRSGVYADGAARGAPAATQVADRWHLLKNVGDVLEQVLGRHREALRAALADASAPVGTAPEPSPATPWRVTPADARRALLYKEIHDLHGQGLSLSAIARRVGRTRITVRKYLRAASCPVRSARPTGLPALGEHEAYLRERWAAGCDNAAQLWRELRARGFAGSAGAVRRYLGAWRTDPRGTGRRRRGSAAVPAPRPPSPKQVRWWLLRAPARRTARQQAYLDRLLAGTEALRLAADLAWEFGRLLRARDLTALDPWLARAEASGLAEFAACAASLRQDEDALVAALTLPWSNGQTEGHVTRLKLVKRQMYGRAKVDLLRRRVLHRAA
jgi:transposase